ncbi:hypothetical protein [Acinetobacter bereziniae]|jgi:hypothetical protein|uniref:Uncharacterized protein n=1 Tax=Acinetobacter bereziniae TaxID=106648 RepID=A0A0A8TQV8_ACIBZ|nr:hypothetical protein [Acinetobacter bereziniae]MEC8122913.1 hypothetical protein [Pseudomonadota bacterium]ATZ65476.1 hypothetical protein BSR55_20180 [Acinetobacter bereziniae]MBI0394840.1 hypothetical protein [Acinetobacter bereziniae]MBJ8443145.1 hypothetical protein [Acinetobacter bereziniae]MBJ9902889.1 hypothetical protein [Acinetobacter bereziniae]
MTFSAILEQFQNLPFGTDAFKQLKINCEDQILDCESDFEKTALFIIYGFAKNYVLLYEDQAITAEFATKAKSQLLDYMHQFNSALRSNNSQQIMQSYNQVSNHYMHSSRIF